MKMETRVWKEMAWPKQVYCVSDGIWVMTAQRGNYEGYIFKLASCTLFSWCDHVSNTIYFTKHDSTNACTMGQRMWQWWVGIELYWVLAPCWCVSWETTGEYSTSWGHDTQLKSLDYFQLRHLWSKSADGIILPSLHLSFLSISPS